MDYPDYGTQPPPNDYNDPNGYQQQPSYEEVYPPKKKGRVAKPFLIVAGVLGIFFSVLYIASALLFVEFMQPAGGTDAEAIVATIFQVIFGVFGMVIMYGCILIFQIIELTFSIVGLSLKGGTKGLKAFSVSVLIFSFAAAAFNVLLSIYVMQNTSS